MYQILPGCGAMFCRFQIDKFCRPCGCHVLLQDPVAAVPLPRLWKRYGFPGALAGLCGCPEFQGSPNAVGCSQFWRYPHGSGTVPHFWGTSGSFRHLAGRLLPVPLCQPSPCGAVYGFAISNRNTSPCAPCVGVWLALYGLLCSLVIIYATMMARSQYGAN